MLGRNPGADDRGRESSQASLCAVRIWMWINMGDIGIPKWAWGKCGENDDYHRWWDVVLPYFHTHAGRCLATNAELYPAGQGSPSFLQVCKVSKVNHLLFFLPAYVSSNWWWLLNPGEKPQIPVHVFVVLKQPGDESMLFVLHQVLKKLYRVRSGLYRLYLCIYFIHMIYDISICMSWCNLILHHISQGWW